MANPSHTNPKFIAAYKFLERTGVRSIQLRYSDDEQPVVWFAVAEYSMQGNTPVAKGGTPRHAVAAGLDPLAAVLGLCEEVTDGGQCVHCGKPTGFIPHDRRPQLAISAPFCWWVWDGGSKQYVRGCA